MKLLKITCAIPMLALAISVSAQNSQSLSTYVNPLIGTGGHGHTYPGPAMPFGMIQPGPDTRLSGWDACGGYHYSDNTIYGFSQTHLSGTGIEDYCDFLFVPSTGKAALDQEAYKSTFQRKNEIAQAGYYANILDKYNVKVEITSTERTGLYRLSYPKNTDGNLLIDLKHKDKTLESWVEIVNDHEIRGYRKSKAWAQKQIVYFHAKFNKPFKTYAIAQNDALSNSLKKADGNNLKALLTFDNTDGKPVLAQVAISGVDEAGALKNLQANKLGFDFEKTKTSAKATWEQYLSKIKVQSTDKDKLTTFYTALYHAFLNPNLYSDVDGRYRGLDSKVHVAKDFNYYTVFSLWDTYRTENPLLTLLDRKHTLDFIKTFLAMYEQNGALPVWPLANEETWCMIGNHAIPVITDAYAKGIRGFDTKLALEAMKSSVNRKQFGIDIYAKEGAVLADVEHESASKTVEYAYDDWCIAQFAKMLGQQADYDTYIRRAQNWKNVYDASTGFIRARNNGGWWKPFNPTEVNNNFTEGNSWHYSFSTQQDVNTHMAYMGGEKIFEAKLNELFTTSDQLTGRVQSDITGLIGQYAHGNEPSHHMAYLFNYTKHPEKTQFYINQIMNTQYRNAPDGLSGNEDCGQMSAWLVMSSLGIFPVSPGNNIYNFGTPWFSKATVKLENGKQIVINALKQSNSNYYINGLSLNQRPYKKLFIDFADLSNGAILNFDLSAKPNLTYQNSLQKPVMQITDQVIVPNPSIEGPAETFKDSAQVSMSCALPDAVIYYTTDGSTPTTTSARYSMPFSITGDANIKAIAVKAGLLQSHVTQANYKIIKNNYTIKVNSQINKSYTGGGNNALIDGVKGALNWRVGNRWQGFMGTDFEAVLDLQRLIDVKTIALGALQDTNAWIVFPPKTEFYAAGNDMQFTLMDTADAPAKPDDYKVQTAEILGKIGTKVRYIKIKAKSFGILPSWSEGVGNPSHLFFDEIVVE